MTVLKVTLNSLAVNKLYDSLTCLSKLGEYVSLDARRTKLTFSAFNTTMSAYGSIDLLAGKFFDNYQFVPDESQSQQSQARGAPEDAKFSCKFLTRALLPVFRSRSQDWKEKDTGIDKCEMSIHDRPNKSQCRLVIKLFCKHGVIKNYRLQYEEVEAMHANFDRRNANGTRNRFGLNSQLLKEYMDHFGPKAENLDISAEAARVTFCSFTEKVADGREILKHPVQTSIDLDTVEFEGFKVEEKIHVVIAVKDFRAITLHADTLNVTVQVVYGDPGNPMHVSYDKEGLVCEFILMTRRKGDIGLLTGAKVTVGGGVGTTSAASSTVPSTQQSQQSVQAHPSRANTTGSISVTSSRMGSFLNQPSFRGADNGGGDMLPPPVPVQGRGSASPVKNVQPRQEKEAERRTARKPSPPIRQSQSLFLMDDDDLFGTGHGEDKDSEDEEENEDVIGWDTSMTFDSFNTGVGAGKIKLQGNREGNADAVPPTQQERVRGLFGD